MKKLLSIYCLLAIGILVIGCDPKSSTPVITLSSDQVCDPAAQGKTNCLALDDDHAVLISLRGDKPELKSLSADSMQFGRGKGWESLKTSLLRSQKGHRFTPKSTEISVEKGDLVFKSAAKEDFRVASASMKGGFLLMMKDGESLVATLYSNADAAPSLCETPVDITGKLEADEVSREYDCTRITISDKICITSLGVIEILDNAIDPDLFVRIRGGFDMFEDVIKGDPDIIRNPGNWLEFDHKNFQMPSKIMPHASAERLPLHFAGNPSTPSTMDGKLCAPPSTYESTVPLCSMHIGSKRILYCNQALYSADDAAGTNKTLILTLSQPGCDLCFTFSDNADGGRCLVISRTNLSACVDGNFCSSLEPCP